MQTQEIPAYEWSRFFDEFSRRHEGWLVTIEMLGAYAGPQVLGHNLPLQGTNVEQNEVGEDEITIIAGGRPDARITHTIATPQQVWLKQSDEGSDEALEIESFAGAVVLTFSSADLPEMAEGVLTLGAESGRRIANEYRE